MPVKAANILFDLDGTLTDSRPGILNTIRHTLRLLDLEPPRDNELLWCVGPPLREVLARLLPNSENATIERAVSVYVDRYDSIGHRENRVYAGVPAMLTILGANRRLVLVTAKRQQIAEPSWNCFSCVLISKVCLAASSPDDSATSASLFTMWSKRSGWTAGDRDRRRSHPRYRSRSPQLLIHHWRSLGLWHCARTRRCSPYLRITASPGLAVGVKPRRHIGFSNVSFVTQPELRAKSSGSDCRILPFVVSQFSISLSALSRAIVGALSLSPKQSSYSTRRRSHKVSARRAT